MEVAPDENTAWVFPDLDTRGRWRIAVLVASREAVAYNIFEVTFDSEEAAVSFARDYDFLDIRRERPTVPCINDEFKG